MKLDPKLSLPLEISDFLERDHALISEHHAVDRAMKIHNHNEGGIDLNPAQMSLQTKREGEDFKFDFNGIEIDATQVTGTTFIIRTMTPVTNLPQILGLI